MDRINKSVPRVTVWHYQDLPCDTNSDLRDGFVYPFLKLMLDHFSCILLGVSVTGEEKGQPDQDSKPRTPCRPCKNSDHLYRATRSDCDNFPLLKEIHPRICSEPCRNQQPEHWPPNVTGEEKAHDPTRARTQDPWQTV